LATLSYSARAISDLERLADFLRESIPSEASATIGLIEEATAVLRRHALIGRPLEADLRELVISRGRTGYVALYRFARAHDAVLILSVRHQREAGYGAEP
jgi:plasmid stabilization system protein ParE